MGLSARSHVCTGHRLAFTHVHCTTWCRTHLLCIALGTEHNCNVHQTPFFPHCTMCHMLDCEKYQGGSSRTTWTSMHREDITALHSRQHWLVVMRLSSSCSWTRLKDADINMQGGHFGSALEVASAGGHKAVIQ